MSDDTNFVPRLDGTGSLGRTDKQWNEVHAKTYHGDGSNLTGITIDQVSGAAPADNYLTTYDNIGAALQILAVGNTITVDTDLTYTPGQYITITLRTDNSLNQLSRVVSYNALSGQLQYAAPYSMGAGVANGNTSHEGPWDINIAETPTPRYTSQSIATGGQMGLRNSNGQALGFGDAGQIILGFDLQYEAGDYVNIAYQDPQLGSGHQVAEVTSYDTETGVLVFDIPTIVSAPFNGANIVYTATLAVAEEVRATAAEETLQANIDAEETARIAADTLLQTQINNISGSGGSGTMGGTMTSHIIPDTNALYDLGNAEYKIRHLFLSDNSLWVGDDHKISIATDGKMKFRKRKNVLPKELRDLGVDAEPGASLKRIEELATQNGLVFENLFQDSDDFDENHNDEVLFDGGKLTADYTNLLFWQYRAPESIAARADLAEFDSVAQLRDPNMKFEDLVIEYSGVSFWEELTYSHWQSWIDNQWNTLGYTHTFPDPSAAAQAVVSMLFNGSVADLPIVADPQNCYSNWEATYGSNGQPTKILASTEDVATVTATANTNAAALTTEISRATAAEQALDTRLTAKESETDLDLTNLTISETIKTPSIGHDNHATGSIQFDSDNYTKILGGMKYPTSISIGDHTERSTSTKRWLKVAEPTKLRLTNSNYDGSSINMTFLVSLTGDALEQTTTFPSPSAGDEMDSSFIVSVRYTPTDEYSGYIVGQPIITCEPLNSTDMGGFDPETDLVFNIGANGDYDAYYSPEKWSGGLWIKSPTGRKRCFISVLGGNSAEEGLYKLTGWTLTPDSSWQSATPSTGFTHTDALYYGRWADKKYRNLEVSSLTVAGALVSGDGVTDYNDLTNKPTIPTKVGDLQNNMGYALTGDYTRSDALHQVATSGDYDDLSSKPDVSAMIATAVDGIVAGAPGTLNTLNEIAAAIADDANIATTLTTAVGTEQTRATAAEGANTSAITAEETRATAAEGANATAITAEETRAIAAEAANATAITAEETRATAAEATLQNAIDDKSSLLDDNDVARVEVLTDNTVVRSSTGVGVGNTEMTLTQGSAEFNSYMHISPSFGGMALRCDGDVNVVGDLRLNNSIVGGLSISETYIHNTSSGTGTSTRYEITTAYQKLSSNHEVTFTAPANGKVKVKFIGMFSGIDSSVGTAVVGEEVYVRIKTGVFPVSYIQDTSGVTWDGNKFMQTDESGNHTQLIEANVDGLTPGQSYTYEFEFKKGSDNTDVNLSFGADFAPTIIRVETLGTVSSHTS